MVCRFVRGFVIGASLLALPALVQAQSAMTGTVKDTSGAVLPGVTVEVSSDALIEKSKAVVTDGDGVYRIVDLRPGTYIVTFTLTGFSSLRREGIELPSEFTATINADMRVGALEESITVTGDAPVVDVTTAVHTQVLNREAMDAIPTGRTIQGMGQLIVGISLGGYIIYKFLGQKAGTLAGGAAPGPSPGLPLAAGRVLHTRDGPRNLRPLGARGHPGRGQFR